MKLHDTPVQCLNPVFRPAIAQYISDIKIPSYMRMINLIYESLSFNRTDQKVIPNVFQTNLHTRFLSIWNHFSYRVLRCDISIFIRNLFINNPRYNQYCISTKIFNLFKKLANEANKFFLTSGSGSERSTIQLSLFTKIRISIPEFFLALFNSSNE